MAESEIKKADFPSENLAISKLLDGFIFLTSRYAMPLVIVLFCGSGLIFTNLYLLSTNVNRSTALQNAELISETLSEFRTLYTSEVVSRIDQHGIDVTFDYQKKDRAIPLPATLSIKLGRSIREKVPGADVRLYSDFPFPFRKDGGPKDEFEEKALNSLRQDPTRPYAQFDDVDGRWSLRYATPDVMHVGCIECHNTHPQSPKRDWKVGDVRGVLEVILPLEGAKESTQKGLLGSMLLISSITFTGLIFLALVIGGLRRSSNEAQILTQKTKRINAELHQEILEREKIEAKLAERSTELEKINQNFQREINDRKQALAESEEARKELEAFNRLAVGRELRMIALKKQINDLLQQQGKDKLYSSDIIDSEQ